jgi:hypothetical protein
MKWWTKYRPRGGTWVIPATFALLGFLSFKSDLKILFTVALFVLFSGIITLQNYFIYKELQWRKQQCAEKGHIPSCARCKKRLGLH